MKTTSNKRKAERKAMRLEAEKKVNFLEKEILYEVCARSMFSEIYRLNKEKFGFLLSKRLELFHGRSR
jgi:hypothetical protein